MFSCQVISLPPKLQQRALKAAVQKMAGNAKIIRLIKPYELFGGWNDDILKNSFEV